MNRRAFLINAAKATAGATTLAAAPALLDACGSSGSSGSGNQPTKVPYQLGWVPNAEFAGTYLAIDKGYFTDAGVDVSVLPGGPNTSPIPIVASGKALVTIADPIVAVSAIAKGADIKIIGAQYEKSPYAITSLASNPIHSPKDMIGKKIGLAASDTTNWEALLKLNDINSDDVHTVPVQFDPTPLADGEIDGLVAFSYEQSSELAQKGIKTVSYLWDDYDFKTMWNTYIVDGSSLTDKAKRKALVGFMTGEIKGWKDQVARPASGASLAVHRFGKSLHLDVEEQTREATAARDLIVTSATRTHGLFDMSPSLVDETISLLKLVGLKSASKAAFTTEILDQVHKADPSLARL